MDIRLTYHLSKQIIDPKIKTGNYWAAETAITNGREIKPLEYKHPHMSAAIAGLIKLFLQEVEFKQNVGEAPQIKINIESNTHIVVDNDVKGILSANMQ